MSTNDITTVLAKPEAEPVSMEIFDLLRRQAAELIKSGFLPTHIKTPEQAVAVTLIGRELGIPMMYALRKICVIQSTPTLAVELMVALARRTGEVEDFRVEDDGEKATVTVKRRGQPTPHTSTFSMADAKGLGLAGKDNWQKQPRTMRQWRAISANLRVTFPDAIGGLYTPEEIAPDLRVDSQGMPAEVSTAVSAPIANPFMPRRKGKCLPAPSEPAAVSTGEGENGRPGDLSLEDARERVSVISPPTAVFGLDQEPLSGTAEEAPTRAEQKVGVGSGSGGHATTPDEFQAAMLAPPGGIHAGVTMELQGKTYHTAGCTRQQALAIFKLRPVLDGLTQPGRAKEIMGRDFGVEHWFELGEKAAGAYIADLDKAIRRAEREMGKGR